MEQGGIGQARRTACRIVVAAMLALLLQQGPARADATVDAYYTIRAAGLVVGRINLSISPVPEGLATRFSFRSDGMLELVRPSHSHLLGLSRATAASLLPVRFEGRYQRGDRLREVEMAYDVTGRISRLALRRDGRPRPGEPPARLMAGTVDPLTAFLRARAWLATMVRAERVGAELAVPVFDGRRRSAIELRYLGQAAATPGGSGMPPYRLGVTLKAMAALDDMTGAVDETPRYRERHFEVRVSADGRYVPLALHSVSDEGWPVGIELTADCTAQPACAVPF